MKIEIQTQAKDHSLYVEECAGSIEVGWGDTPKFFVSYLDAKRLATMLVTVVEDAE